MKILKISWRIVTVVACGQEARCLQKPVTSFPFGGVPKYVLQTLEKTGDV